MGVVVCPECGGKVSETLSTCPHCGFVLSGGIKEDQPSSVHPESQEPLSKVNDPSEPRVHQEVAASSAQSEKGVQGLGRVLLFVVVLAVTVWIWFPGMVTDLFNSATDRWPDTGPVRDTVIATELDQEFESNSVAAGQRYVDKTVIILGVVNSVGPGFVGSDNPWLRPSHTRGYPLLNVNLIIKSDQDVSVLEKGRRFAARCKYDDDNEGTIKAQFYCDMVHR